MLREKAIQPLADLLGTFHFLDLGQQALRFLDLHITQGVLYADGERRVIYA